jgi:hypothetical protein
MSQSWPLTSLGRHLLTPAAPVDLVQRRVLPTGRVRLSWLATSQLRRRQHAALHERVALHQTHTRSDSRGARPRQRKNNNMTTKYCSDEQLERVINTPSTPCAASCGVPLGTLNLINGDTWRPAQFASSLSRILCDQAACWPRGRVCSPVRPRRASAHRWHRLPVCMLRGWDSPHTTRPRSVCRGSHR